MRDVFGIAARSEPLMCSFKCSGAFPFFLPSGSSYIRTERDWLLISCFLCTCRLLFHLQVDVILAQRNRKPFFLDEENFYFIFLFVINLSSVIWVLSSVLISPCRYTGCLQFPLNLFGLWVFFFCYLKKERTQAFSLLLRNIFIY